MFSTWNITPLCLLIIYIALVNRWAAIPFPPSLYAPGRWGQDVGGCGLDTPFWEQNDRAFIKSSIIE